MKSDTPRVILFRGIRKHGKGFVYGDLVRKFDTTYIVVYIKERGMRIEVIPERNSQGNSPASRQERRRFLRVILSILTTMTKVGIR